MGVHQTRIADADLTTLGGKIRHLRIRRGMTQEQLGMAAAKVIYPSGRWTYSKSVLSLIEHNRTMPSLAMFKGLTAALDTSADYLLFGKGGEHGTQD